MIPINCGLVEHISSEFYHSPVHLFLSIAADPLRIAIDCCTQGDTARGTREGHRNQSFISNANGNDIILTLVLIKTNSEIS